MGDQSRVMAGAVAGALLGALAGFLFFTERGRGVRERIEPAIDEARREVVRLQQAVDKLGELADDGVRMVHEFKLARAGGTDEARPSGRAH